MIGPLIAHDLDRLTVSAFSEQSQPRVAGEVASSPSFGHPSVVAGRGRSTVQAVGRLRRRGAVARRLARAATGVVSDRSEHRRLGQRGTHSWPASHSPSDRSAATSSRRLRSNSACSRRRRVWGVSWLRGSRETNVAPETIPRSRDSSGERPSPGVGRPGPVTLEGHGHGVSGSFRRNGSALRVSDAPGETGCRTGCARSSRSTREGEPDFVG